MNKIKFAGWRPEVRIISFIKLLKKDADLTLTEAKELSDIVTNENESVEITIDDLEKAKLFVKEATELGIKCELVSRTQYRVKVPKISEVFSGAVTSEQE